MGYLHGKIEQTLLVYFDLTDGDLFPDLQPSVYMDTLPLENGDIAHAQKSTFEPLQDYSLMTLFDLPTFGSTGEVACQRQAGKDACTIDCSKIAYSTYWLGVRCDREFSPTPLVQWVLPIGVSHTMHEVQFPHSTHGGDEVQFTQHGSGSTALCFTQWGRRE